MNVFYRVVKEDWSKNNIGKKSVSSLGLVYDSIIRANRVMTDDVLYESNRLNRGKAGLPFQIKFDTGYDCAIVSIAGLYITYNIFNVSFDADRLENANYYRYRGFVIVSNNNHTSFSIKAGEIVVGRKRKLESALLFIDEYWLGNYRRDSL